MIIELDQYTLDINIIEYSAGEGAIPKPSVEFEIVSGIMEDSDLIPVDMDESDIYDVMRNYSSVIEEMLLDQIKRNREDEE